MYPFYETKKSDKACYFTTFTSNNMSFPPHLHSYVELIYVTHGNIAVTINNTTKELTEGDIGVSFPNDIHSYDTKKYSKVIVAIFSPEIISSYFSKVANKTLKDSFICKENIDKSVYVLIDMLYAEVRSSNDEFVIKGFLYSIFGKLNQKFTFINSKHTYNTTIQSLLKYIEGHYNENITLESTAKALGFSKFYLSRLFANKIGYNFNDYVNRLRVNMAQKLISETDMLIFNIALECGFESLRNFNRVFKGYIGVTPTEFRKEIDSSKLFLK